MGKSKDLASGNSAAYVETAGDTMTGTLVAGTILQVCDTSITQQYPALGYVADFQASSGSQTFISIAEPSASSLGNNGVIIGEDASDTYITQRGNKNIKLATQDLNRLIVDGSGRVTTPYNPYFWVQAANAGAANYSSGAVLFTGSLVNSSSISDIGGHFDTSTGRFTAPVSGVYHFSAVVRVDSFGGSYSYLTLWDSGSVAFCRDLSDITGNYKTHTVAASRYLSANDYVYSHMVTTGDTSTTISSDSYFSGHLVG